MEEIPDSGLSPQYQTYERQKCFIGYSRGARWRADIESVCREVLQGEFNLEPWYADEHPDPTMILRDKVVEMIANTRYGIYDLSYWRKDDKSEWVMPRNVFIELGMAIALNRPTLLLRHAENGEAGLKLPACLESVSGHILEFSGKTTLRDALRKCLPQWRDVPLEQDWWNRYCDFGRRICEYREAYPRTRQWGQETLCCHVSDGQDKDRPDFRSVVEEVLGRYSDLTFEYLDALSITKGYDFLFCTLCQKVRSTPFAIYRVTPKTPAETFIAIGMSIALEKQFQHEIPKILLTASVRDVPSLLYGYEVVAAQNDTERKARLQKFMPVVVQKIRKTAWKPRLLPFIEVVPRHVEKPHYSGKVETEIITVDEVVEISDETIVKPEAIPVDETSETNEEPILDTAVAARGPQTAQMETQERQHCAQVAQQATGRQLDVLRAFAEGLSPQEVADHLCLSIKTVDTHKTVLLWLCRTAWNKEPNESLDYRFLYKTFAAYFNNDEASGLDAAGIGKQERLRCAQVAQQATGRQLDVLRAFAEGLSPQEVASQLGLTIKTVDTHKTVLLGLCRKVWNIEEGTRLGYHFLYKTFVAYFDSEESSSLDPARIEELQAVPGAPVTLELPASGNEKQELGGILAGTEKYVARSSTRTAKVFVLGRPGSGKSTAARRIAKLAQHEGLSVIRISDYEILYEMYNKEMHQPKSGLKQFSPAEYNGFNVVDFSVLDTALKVVERKAQEQISFGKNAFILIEFARDDYRKAFKLFAPHFLEDAYFLFINDDIDTCIQRIRQQVSYPNTTDDHFVSEDVLRSYYTNDNIPYMTHGIQIDYGIDSRRVQIINNSGSSLDFAEGVTQFIRPILEEYLRKVRTPPSFAPSRPSLITPIE